MSSYPKFHMLTPEDEGSVLPGTILFLPPKEIVPTNAHAEAELPDGAYNHPVIVISTPSAKGVVKIAVMTSFSNTSIRLHLASKGIKRQTGAIAAAKGGYLRVVTASKPTSKDSLKLRFKKGMKRDSSYVGIKRTFKIGLRALALYGRRNEAVDSYRLTGHALRLLEEGLEKWSIKMKSAKHAAAESMQGTKEGRKKAGVPREQRKTMVKDQKPGKGKSIRESKLDEGREERDRKRRRK
ncbi:hypothetical protein BJ875DRAFT_517596 [Amylocarpus encephaloides]|uniref:Uncharacterized protein n=1 Tax=Amylocarpus encephaloides TaxID=45428 RepID=A0A9P7YCS4_9HELO|nr:hypothetical protein BJ875DRAFT_517596 [Amylocarpus encephaloides]